MRLLLSACLFLFTATVFAEEAVREVKTANPFITLHPESQQASVAMKCVYCIPAHAAFARAAGATEEEIKTAVAIAADVALNSSMLYGSQFDMDTFMKMFE